MAMAGGSLESDNYWKFLHDNLTNLQSLDKSLSVKNQAEAEPEPVGDGELAPPEKKNKKQSQSGPSLTKAQLSLWRELKKALSEREKFIQYILHVNNEWRKEAFLNAFKYLAMEDITENLRNPTRSVGLTQQVWPFESSTTLKGVYNMSTLEEEDEDAAEEPEEGEEEENE